MLTRSAKWMSAISVLFFAFALGMMFEAKASRGSASEVASLWRPAIVNSAPVLQGGAGTAFTYQGRLEDAGGPADGRFDFRFRLFDAPVDGAQVGETLCVDNIAVSDGLFTVRLDFGQQYATPDPRFLEVEVRRDSGLDCANVAGFVLLAPRQQLTATPLASHAIAAFALDAADGSPASAVFVDNVGNVGVGTTAPVGGLHVAREPLTFGGTLTLEGITHTYMAFFPDGRTAGRKGYFGFASPTTNDITIGNEAPGGRIVLSTRNGNTFATGGEENLRIVRGVVTAAGGIIVGSGFTVSRTGTGQYTITFNTPFAGPPAVTATTEFTELKPSYVMTDGVFTNRVNLRVWEDNGTFNRMKNDAFHFIAIGPR